MGFATGVAGRAAGVVGFAAGVVGHAVLADTGKQRLPLDVDEVAADEVDEGRGNDAVAATGRGGPVLCRKNRVETRFAVRHRNGGRVFQMTRGAFFQHTHETTIVGFDRKVSGDEAVERMAERTRGEARKEGVQGLVATGAF